MKVCLCFDVSDRVIREHARAGASLEQLLSATQAGSSCGGCRIQHYLAQQLRKDS